MSMKLIPKCLKGNTIELDAIKDNRPTIYNAVERKVGNRYWSLLTPKERWRNRPGFNNGRPVEKGLEIVSPEFDILTGIRGLSNSVKGVLKWRNIKLKNGSNKPSNNFSKEVIDNLLRLTLEKKNINAEILLTYDTVGNPVNSNLKKAIKFYDEDLPYRELGLNIFRGQRTFSKPEIKLEPFKKNSNVMGYATRNTIVVDKNTKYPLDDIFVHEGTHIDLFNKANKNLNLVNISSVIDAPNVYNLEETDLLNRAYTFTDDFLDNLDMFFPKLLEKGASNRDLRYAISKQNNVVRKELDNVIDNLSNDDLGYHLSLGSGYHKDFLSHIRNNKETLNLLYLNIRDALKYVPVTMLGINSTIDINGL